MSWSGLDRQFREESSPRSSLPQGLGIGLAIALVLLGAIVAASLWYHRPPPLPLPPSPLPRPTDRGKGVLVLGEPNAWDIQPLTANSPPAGVNDLRGKVVLLSFWSIWCGKCRQKLPELVDLYHRFASRNDFCFLAVSCLDEPWGEREAHRKETAAFLAQEGYNIPTYADSDRVTRERLVSLGAFNNYYPTTILLDREGKIAAVWDGDSPQTIQAVEQTLRRLLDAKQPQR